MSIEDAKEMLEVVRKLRPNPPSEMILEMARANIELAIAEELRKIRKIAQDLWDYRNPPLPGTEDKKIG